MEEGPDIKANRELVRLGAFAFVLSRLELCLPINKLRWIYSNYFISTRKVWSSFEHM